jgi:type II secretion system protein C
MNLTAMTHRVSSFSRDIFSLEFVRKPTSIIFVFGKLACAFAAWQLYQIGIIAFDSAHQKSLELSPRNSISTEQKKVNEPLSAFEPITRRALFGKAPIENAPPAPVSKLRLRLVGTNVGSKENSFAIIEDSSKNEQDVFDLNEKVFNQAKLIEIQRELVKIETNGKVETLLLDDGVPAPKVAATEDAAPSDDQTDFAVSESELNDSLSNLPLLLSQARAVPYFRNGQSIGMRLFAIRKDSMYEKLGLQNGDIITTVNENSLSDPSQAIRLFEQLKNEKQVTVKLERNGSERAMNYSIR